MLDSPDRGVVLAIAFALVAAPLVGSAVAQTEATGLLEDGPESWEQTHKLLPDAAGAQFGISVAMDGEDFMVGAPAQEKVYVYKDTDDGPVRHVFPATPDGAKAQYGTAVDLDGDLAAVGANGNAFVFERVSAWTWEHVGTLTPPGSPSEDTGDFGGSVAVDDQTNTAIVGAAREDTDVGTDAGAAFVYSGDAGTWALDQTLSPTSPNEADRFGTAVALEATTAIVGAPGDDTAGSNAGAVYVFKGGDSGWMQTSELQGSQASEDLGFGGTVALDGSRAMVGTEDPAYVFDGLPANPSEQARLVPDDRVVSGSTLGQALTFAVGDVGIDGDTAVIGGYGPFFVQPGGQAFVFEEAEDGSWTQATELAQRDPESHAAPADAPGFGWAVAIDGDRALVGAPFEDSVQGQRDGGGAYLFAPCTDDGSLSGPVHDQVEPQTGPAQEDVHDVNCNWIASNGG